MANFVDNNKLTLLSIFILIIAVIATVAYQVNTEVIWVSLLLD